MDKYHIERFNFLSDKLNSKRANPREIAEYNMLLDQWSESSKNDIIDNYLLNTSRKIIDRDDNE